MKKQTPNTPLPSGFIPMDALYRKVETILARQDAQMKVDSGRSGPQLNKLNPGKSVQKKP